jgi:hypothetical protein
VVPEFVKDEWGIDLEGDRETSGHGFLALRPAVETLPARVRGLR